MKDQYINYAKIMDALNHSLSALKENGSANQAVESLSSAQQDVQQAIIYTLTKDYAIYK